MVYGLLCIGYVWAQVPEDLRFMKIWPLGTSYPVIFRVVSVDPQDESSVRV